MTNLEKTHFYDFVSEIKSKIREAQLAALRVVNWHLIELYLSIGEMIVERQKEHGWGKAVTEMLSKELQKEFPGIKGYSPTNLRRMRFLYLNCKENPNLPPLVGEIGWSHNILIFEKCKDALQREFYLRATKKFGWSKNVLIHQIENQSYEKCFGKPEP